MPLPLLYCEQIGGVTTVGTRQATEVFLAQRLAPEVRRERILDTAMELLGEKGYRGLTMKTVAARCGLTAPAVTYYFKDMQTLLLAVLERRGALDVAEFFSSGSDGTLTAEDIAVGVYRAMTAHPHAARLRTVMSIEAMDPSHPAHAACLERNEAVIAFLASRLGGGSRRRRPAGQEARRGARRRTGRVASASGPHRPAVLASRRRPVGHGPTRGSPGRRLIPHCGARAGVQAPRVGEAPRRRRRPNRPAP